MAIEQSFCAICAHDIKSKSCPHPWHKPFTDWPKEPLEKVKAMLQSGPVAGS